MKFRVDLTDAAKADIRAILTWIEGRSASGADAWYRRWLGVLKTLQQSADDFGLAPESADHSEPISQIVFKTKRGLPYRALFAIRADEVFILRVRGPGQDLI